MTSAGAGNDHIVGIDVGGSSIKGALVDAGTGAVLGEPERRPAPAGFEPAAVLGLVAEIADSLAPAAPVGVGFPAVVRNGVLGTDATSHQYPGWNGLTIEAELGRLLGRPVAVGNDADVAGAAELRWGAAQGARGTVLVLTFGTGIGSAVFRDGVLVPNVELGRIYLEGRSGVVEDFCAARVIAEEGLSLEVWAGRLGEYLTHLERILAPDLIVIGGAVSSESERFLPRLETRARLVPARFGGNAGMAGAALVAAGLSPSDTA